METAERRIVEPHRRCPLCHEGALNGVGHAYSTQAPVTYYKCDRCGHTWSCVIRRTATVTHREINVQHQESEVTERASTARHRRKEGK